MKVYGICEDKCRTEVLPKSQASGVASIQEFEVESGTPFFEYDYPNYKMIYKDASAIEVSLPKAIEELTEEQPNFNATIILQNRYRFNSVLSNVFKVRFAGTIYPVKFLTPTDFTPQFCTVLHFNMFYDGFNICCNVQGY